MTTQPDLVTRLNEISAMQGREPLPDPTKIQDFGEPPPPPYPVRPPVDLSQVPEEPFKDDIDEPFLVPSPLIPREPDPSPKLSIETPDLTVFGNDGKGTIASYKQWQVELSQTEAAAIRKVVLKAIARVVRVQLSGVQSLLPKRKRRASPKPTGVPRTEGGAPSPPKRRGRPPKPRLDGGVR